MRIDLHTNTDEALLVTRCKKKDEQAQKILYMRYVEDMMVLCMRYISDREDAREVLMDAFLKFYNSISDFEYRGEGSVKAWLKKIVVSYCLMFLRKNRLTFESTDDERYHAEIAAQEHIVEEMNAKEILLLIHGLPAGCKTVFNLYIFEGQTHKEIAQTLGISEGTSKSQLHLAKSILKSKILINS